MKRLLLALLVTGACQAQSLVSPAFPVWVQPNTRVDFEVEAATGLTIRLDLPAGPLALTEETPGHYRGAALCRTAGRVRMDGQDLGEIALMGDKLQVVEVTGPRSVFRCGPDPDYERYDPVATGVRFVVVGREGNWLHVKEPDAWIEVKNVRFLADGAGLHPGRLQNVTVKETPAGAAEVRIKLGAPCAWQIREEPELHRVLVSLPGFPSAMHEMRFAQNARRIPAGRIHAYPDGSKIELMLTGGLFGFQTRYEAGDLVLTFAAPVVGEPQTPLRGLRIVLDAGHGGKDQGAIGLHGRKEKELNLACTLALQKELQDAGALVTLTRDTDREVSPDGSSAELELSSRADLAEQAEGQLFVSIHHNAMANITAGRQAHGTHVYYYHPHSRALALAVAQPLAASIQEESYMHLWRSFAVIRQSAMPAILVESNFVSNPKLEDGMLGAPDYPQKVARGLREGIETFVLGNVK